MNLLHKLEAIIFHAQAASVFHTGGCVVDHQNKFMIIVFVYWFVWALSPPDHKTDFTAAAVSPMQCCKQETRLWRKTSSFL
ncbi:hypothetical protein LEMLEM_LOCUS19825 [Lemmus lemmus]